MNNYFPYHIHTKLSLLDSCTDFHDYVDKCKECGIRGVAFTEHGNVYNWTEKKRYCDSQSIKYVHGVEIYLTARLFHKKINNKNEIIEYKLRDNFHTILLAKNYEGVQEINKLVSLSSTESHYYYRPRITFDEFLNISSNVICISACLGGPLSKIPLIISNLSQRAQESQDENILESCKFIESYIDKLCQRYDYYEIQYHNNNEQIKYNQHLYNLSKKYNKPLIAATDTHSLNSYKSECRKILMIGKDISFGNENEYDFDLTFKSYEELLDAFKIQNSVDVYVEAVENTNKLLDSIEDFTLDISIKYPKISENDNELFYKLLEEKFKDKIDKGIIPLAQIDKFKEGMKEECGVFEKTNMVTFMLSMTNIMNSAKSQGIKFGPLRGSVGGSAVAFVLDIIELNPYEYNMIFSRFCNEDRVEVGDIDVDLSGDDREKVFNIIIDQFTSIKTARVLALGTVSEKATIDLIGKALKIPLKEVKQIKELYSFNPDKAKKKYPNLFYYFDGILNTTVSQSIHAAGIVIAPCTLRDNYGTLISDGIEILQLDMDAIHECGLVKYDLLGLRTIKTITETYKLLNESMPKWYELDYSIPDVWNSMLKSNIALFQFEQQSSFRILKEFKPNNLYELALVTAMIRPSGASYREELSKRQTHKNPSDLIDNLLKESYGRLVFQEQIIAFLQQICGLTGSQADTVRRGIARKKKELLDEYMGKIIEGYCLKSDKPKEVAKDEAKQFLQVIEDASAYMFGLNHSIGYCAITYHCAYLRHFYPIEFITALFNTIESEDDIVSATNLAKLYKIKINEIKFGYSKYNYFIDKKTNSIYKGLRSVKYMNEKCADKLYEFRNNNYNTFNSLLIDIKKSKCIDERQLQILIKLDFFSDFGNSFTLLKIYQFCTIFKFGEAVSIKKENITSPIIKNIIERYSKTTNKQYRIIDCNKILEEVENYLKAQRLEDFPIKEKIITQIENLGYVALKTNKEEDRSRLVALDIRALPTKDKKRIWAYAIKTLSVGSGKTSEILIYAEIFDKNPFQQYNIINVDISSLYYKIYLDKRSWYLKKYKVEF